MIFLFCIKYKYSHLHWFLIHNMLTRIQISIWKLILWNVQETIHDLKYTINKYTFESQSLLVGEIQSF